MYNLSLLSFTFLVPPYALNHIHLLSTYYSTTYPFDNHLHLIIFGT